jgi:hypothetical protein
VGDRDLDRDHGDLSSHRLSLWLSLRMSTHDCKLRT